MPMATKIGKMAIYNEELPFMKLNDPSVKCSYEFT